MIKSTLKVRMAERDLTFKALVQQTRITPRTLSHMVNDTALKLDVTVLARLCQVLGCQVWDLLPWVPDGDELPKKRRAQGIPANPSAVHARRPRRVAGQ